MENSDALSRSVYREEAKYIEEIRKGIIEVSGREEPYDIFICYKETAEDGQRTLDSVLAQDIYDELTGKGYRVFFSRITLEDKLGVEYEPYIFAALNSAKIMLAFGTSYDYYNAVWVKNEWSRYLKLMAADKSRHLIPCYKDIDAYDIPKEFAKLQAQDLGKVGATQDLLRGIDKIMGRDAASGNGLAAGQQAAIQQVASGGPNVDALLKRGYDSLEDGAFDEAKTFFNDALNSNAESPEAYLGLFMAEIKAKDRLAAQQNYVAGDYTQNRYWKRAKQYAVGELANTLKQWDSLREERLQREADAAQKAKEAADLKAREEEETRKKKLAQIKKLQEQLRAGNFEMTDEEKAEYERLNAEAARLEELIASKRVQLAGLGLFKGKEKKELQAQIDRLALAVCKVGDVVKFGRYEQGNDAAPVEWQVIDKQNKKALLISKYVIDFKPFDNTPTYITWENCDLRKWLNTGFPDTAFSEAEQRQIIEAKCPVDKNPDYNTAIENATTDKVILLSITEVEKYFKSDADRKAAPTAYAKKQGAVTLDKLDILDKSDIFKTAEGEACTLWWLRSPGSISGCAAYVSTDGSVNSHGIRMVGTNGGVRPALWIDLESLISES